jgi:glycyl-tRNA synthetase beta chain
MAKDFLLEIGTEEIPARFMRGALNELRIKAEALFQEERLKYQSLTTYGTPRRLVLYINQLQQTAEAKIEEKKGPSVKVALDKEGRYTKAAIGFAKGHKITPEQLVTKETANGDYVFAILKEEGKEIAKLFPCLLPKLVVSLEFPKPMRWGSSQMRFIRPIRWLVSLYGNQVIPIELDGLVAGNLTRGHRFLGQPEVKLDSAHDFFKVLEQEWVLVDQKRRKELVWKQIVQLAAEYGGTVKPDERLLEEITFLVEYPTGICGQFAQQYLGLPQEVLITVMKEHQRYFPLWDNQGQLMARFIAIRNGGQEHLGVVKAGNERVLEARLSDARFFFDEDVKEPLEAKVEQLKAVVFQDALGTVYQKLLRIKELTSFLSDTLGLSPQAKTAAERAAYLAKADLVSSMVIEFPELQGIMGYYYALHQNETKEVATAIKEHYQPRYAEDGLPTTAAATVVAIADKLDTICGCFAVGIKPSGSGDPYALRRQARGICLMVIEGQLDLDLMLLVEQGLKAYCRQGLDLDEGKTAADLSEFFKQRLANLLSEKGIAYDVINCVLAGRWGRLASTAAKAAALWYFKENEAYKGLLEAYTRVANLAKNAVDCDVKEELLIEAGEKRLWQTLNQLVDRTDSLWKNEQYLELLIEFSTLKPWIDEFFDSTMVMVDDQKLKNNRLALLGSIVQYIMPFGDLAKLVQ